MSKDTVKIVLDFEEDVANVIGKVSLKSRYTRTGFAKDALLAASAEYCRNFGDEALASEIDTMRLRLRLNERPRYAQGTWKAKAAAWSRGDTVLRMVLEDAEDLASIVGIERVLNEKMDVVMKRALELGYAETQVSSFRQAIQEVLDASGFGAPAFNDLETDFNSRPFVSPLR